MEARRSSGFDKEHSLLAVEINFERMDDDAVVRAVRHHRRGVAALEGMSFEGLSVTTTERLLARMKQDLRMFEEELERRGLALSAL